MDTLERAQELLRKGINPSVMTAMKEQPQRISGRKEILRVGVPKETEIGESRVALTPGAVGVLVANGCEVFVEHNAGIAAQFTDKAYTDAGAFIAYTPEEIYSRANIIVKIAPLKDNELELLQPRQTLISAVHLGHVKPHYIKTLLEKSITGVGFEFIQAPDGSIPIMRMVSEIAGISSIHIAADLLSGRRGGKGMLLGGITGVPPAVVTIIGAGTVGLHASRTALGLGAHVKVLDSEVYKLKRLEETIGNKVFTVVSQQDYVHEAVASADVVIGAAFRKGQRAPQIVTDEMVASMREGSVIIDVAIDQGGCVETSRITNHDNPTFLKHGVIHYCVPNIASRVAYTASVAISNILGPLVLQAADGHTLDAAICEHASLKRGVYTYHRHITQRSIAGMFGMSFMDIDLLHAVNL